MDAREFDFVDPDHVAEVNAEAAKRGGNPMEAAFAAGWKPWFEAMKRCAVVVKEE